MATRYLVTALVPLVVLLGCAHRSTQMIRQPALISYCDVVETRNSEGVRRVARVEGEQLRTLQDYLIPVRPEEGISGGVGSKAFATFRFIRSDGSCSEIWVDPTFRFRGTSNQFAFLLPDFRAFYDQLPWEKER